MAVSQARWVVLLWILGMASLGLSLWASAVLVPGAVTWQEAVWALLFGSAFLAVGAVLVVRRPAATVGRLCLLTGLTMAAAADLRTFAILLDRQPGPIPPIGAVAANLSSVGTSFAALILGAVLLARFPDGRDRGRLANLADVTVVLASVGLLASLFVPGPIDAGWLRLPTANPLGADVLANVDPADLANLSLGVYAVAVIASAAILVRRYRRSGPVVRAQVRWVAAAGIVPIVLFLVLLVVGNAIQGGVGDAPVVGVDPVDDPAADGDRRRDPALPPLRHRPDHQPDDRLRDRDRGAGPDIRGHDPRAPGGSGLIHAGPDDRRRGVDARGRRPVPAAPATRPASRGPAVRPGSSGR